MFCAKRLRVCICELICFDVCCPVLWIDPKISTLTPNGHLDLAPLPNARGLYPSERLSFALGSRKSSVSSLGRASLEQTTLVSHFCQS